MHFFRFLDSQFGYIGLLLVRPIMLFVLSRMPQVKWIGLSAYPKEENCNTKLNDLIRYSWSELEQNTFFFPLDRVYFFTIVFLQVTIMKMKPWTRNHFLWAANVLKSMSCLKFMPLFKDSHLACCVTESFHNLLLPILTSITVEKTLEEDK